MKIQYHDLSVEDLKRQTNILVNTIYQNKFIPENHRRPLDNQIDFLTYESEELLYGGQAGGGKSEALLLAALQYVEEKHIPEGENKLTYDGLILRRTLDDLEMPGAILDRAKEWLLPLEDTGLVHYRDLKKKFTFSSGATLTFRYLAHNNDLNKYQGAELQYIAFDELTQFPENQYSYLHSRLRKKKDNPIPLRMRAGTNPGGIGHDWVKAKFINGDVPFIPSSYLENIYLNQEEYTKQLLKITNELDRQRLMHGDWDIQMTSGLLINRDRLVQNLKKITDECYPVFSTIGIDPAGEGQDKFAMSNLTLFTNQKLMLTDLNVTMKGQHANGVLRNFILRNRRFNPVVINFEKEGGSDGDRALDYWKGVLGDLISPNNIINTAASTTGSKYLRAEPHALAVHENRLFFNEELLNQNIGDYNPMNSLFNQYVYVNPSKEEMKKYSSPDELDSLGYAFIAMEDLLKGQTTMTVGARIGG